jgi:hypothetical protein
MQMAVSLSGGSSSVWRPYQGVWNSADAASGAVVSATGIQLTSSSTGVGGARGTIALAGKVYWSVTLAVNPGPSGMIGIANSSLNISSQTPGGNANGWGYYSNDGQFYNGGAGSGTAPTYTIGDIVTIAVDVAASSIWFAKNGVWAGNPLTGVGAAFSNLSGTLYPWAGDVTGTIQSKYSIIPPGVTPWGLA